MRLRETAHHRGSKPVAKPEWGKKRLCPSCGTKFYDLRKSPPACPQCGETIDVEAPTKSKRSRGGGKDSSRAKAPAAAAAPAEPEEVVADESEAEPLADDSYAEEESSDLEDTSEIGEDEALGTFGGDDDEESN
jgi:uncharacterized protein (TIGR02300 family)